MPYLAAAALEDEVLAMEDGAGYRHRQQRHAAFRRSGAAAGAGKNACAIRGRVLVLDDPFSALDRNTEDTVFANLQDYAKDKVVFLISHRLYHFPQMQQVIFMEDGKTTVGTHEELMASVPAYRQLYESQTGGQQHEERHKNGVFAALRDGGRDAPSADGGDASVRGGVGGRVADPAAAAGTRASIA